MNDFNDIEGLINKVTNFDISTRNYYILDINHHGCGKVLKINNEIIDLIKGIVKDKIVKDKIDLICNEVLEESDEENNKK